MSGWRVEGLTKYVRMKLALDRFLERLTSQLGNFGHGGALALTVSGAAGVAEPIMSGHKLAYPPLRSKYVRMKLASGP